jgi:hypothetical protein
MWADDLRAACAQAGVQLVFDEDEPERHRADRKATGQQRAAIEVYVCSARPVVRHARVVDTDIAPSCFAAALDHFRTRLGAPTVTERDECSFEDVALHSSRGGEGDKVFRATTLAHARGEGPQWLACLVAQQPAAVAAFPSSAAAERRRVRMREFRGGHGAKLLFRESRGEASSRQVVVTLPVRVAAPGREFRAPRASVGAAARLLAEALAQVHGACPR